MNMFKRAKVLKLFVGYPGIPVNEINMDCHGIFEDLKHYGPIRIADRRKRDGSTQVDEGKYDENWRMISVISNNEVEFIKNKYEEKYGLNFTNSFAEFISPNIVLEGIDCISNVPVGTIIDFAGAGPTIYCTSKNYACKKPGQYIANEYGLPVNDSSQFVDFSLNQRGIVGKILIGGRISLGNECVIYYPKDVSIELFK